VTRGASTPVEGGKRKKKSSNHEYASPESFFVQRRTGEKEAAHPVLREGTVLMTSQDLKNTEGGKKI